MMQKVVLVPLAKGFEELEAVTIIDVLRRAGARVVVAGLDSTDLVQSQGGIFIRPDSKMELIEPQNIDMIVLPGGWGGTVALASHPLVRSMVEALHKRQKPIGAICAAPYALSEIGVIGGRYTCYPGIQEKIQEGEFVESPVVESDHILTSQGPATALPFALALVEKLFGKTQRDEVARAMLVIDS